MQAEAEGRSPAAQWPLHCLLQTPARFQPRLVETQTPDMSVDVTFSTSDR